MFLLWATTRYIQAWLSLAELLNYCALIGREQSLDISHKFLIPTSTDPSHRLRVNMSMDFQRILYIDEKEHFIRMTFTLWKFWYNEHLTYQNLKQGAVNQIFEDDKDSIWIPFIESRTMEEVNKCARTEKREILKIIPNRDFRHEQNALTERENAFLFPGLENKMVQEKEYSCDFICEFDYKWYPFDTQVIKLRVI